MKRRLAVLTLILTLFVCALAVKAQRGGGPDPNTDPFTGVTADGTIRAGLFAIRSTGVSTKPLI